MTDWQPIDTAPKYGDILVVVGDPDIRYMHCRKVDIAHRDLSGTLFLSHEGWDLKPKFWMPLPEPPK